MVHIGAVRQTAQITWMSTEALRTGDKAIVTFKFVKCPEWITAERRFVFREGRTKAVSIHTSFGLAKIIWVQAHECFFHDLEWSFS